MTAINKIICTFSLGIGFAFASPAGSSINKVGKVDSIKINKGGRNLQFTTTEPVDACGDEVCGAECRAFDSCENYSGACYDKSFELSISSVNWCSVSSAVKAFCEVQQEMTILCTQDCQDEMQALTGCMLMWGVLWGSLRGLGGAIYSIPYKFSPVTETPTEIPTETPTETPYKFSPVTEPPPIWLQLKPQQVHPYDGYPIDVACYDEGEALGLCLVSAGVTNLDECNRCPLNAAISSGIDGCSSSDVDSFNASVQSCGDGACPTTCLDKLQAAADCLINEYCPDASDGTTAPPANSPSVLENPKDEAATTAPTSRPTNAAAMGGGFANGFGGFAFISFASIVYAVGIM